MSYFMQQDQPPILDAIDAFLEKAAMSPITFGRKALGDPHFVKQLREGRRLWPETEGKVRDFMASYVADAPSEAAA